MWHDHDNYKEDTGEHLGKYQDPIDVDCTEDNICRSLDRKCDGHIHTRDALKIKS